MTLLTERRPAVRPPSHVGTPLPSLTGMRWCAAFVVFAYHVRNFEYFGGETGRIVDWIFGSGTVGVSFFFILSGFILAWSHRPGQGAVGFWRRRLARIYPVHLVTAALALVLAFTLVPGLRPSGFPEAAANVLLVGAWKPQWWQTLNPVSWSLVCEAFFYAAFPALYAVLRRFGSRHLVVLMAVSAAIVVFLPWAKLHYSLDWDPAHLPLTRFPEFVLGAAAGRLVQIGAWRGPGVPTSLALLLIGYWLTRHVPDPYAYAACTLAGMVCLIPAAALADLNGTPSWWRHRWLVRLGEWSFAFYMIHLLVLRTGEQLFAADPRLDTAPALAAATGAFLVSLLLAWALYERVEQPGRQWLLRGTRLRPAVH